MNITIAFVAGLIVGSLTGFWVGAAARMWSAIWPRRRDKPLPPHSLTGGRPWGGSI